MKTLLLLTLLPLLALSTPERRPLKAIKPRPSPCRLICIQDRLNDRGEVEIWVFDEIDSGLRVRSYSLDGQPLRAWIFPLPPLP